MPRPSSAALNAQPASTGVSSPFTHTAYTNNHPLCKQAAQHQPGQAQSDHGPGRGSWCPQRRRRLQRQCRRRRGPAERAGAIRLPRLQVSVLFCSKVWVGGHGQAGGQAGAPLPSTRIVLLAPCGAGWRRFWRGGRDGAAAILGRGRPRPSAARLLPWVGREDRRTPTRPRQPFIADPRPLSHPFPTHPNQPATAAARRFSAPPPFLLLSTDRPTPRRLGKVSTTGRGGRIERKAPYPPMD